MFRYEMFINLSLGFLLIFSSEVMVCLLNCCIVLVVYYIGLYELYYSFLCF